VKIANNAVTRAKLSTDLQEDIVGINYLINPHMQAWQAGPLASGSGQRYSVDGFVQDSIGTTYSVSMSTFPFGAAVFPQGSDNFPTINVTSVAGAGNFCIFGQRIENADTCATKQVTVSFYAKANAARTIAVELVQFFGTGGAPSSPVFTLMGQQAITTGWTRYSLTATVPSVSGKALGSNGDDFLGLYIWLDAGSNFNARTGSLGQQSGVYDFWGFKLEEGPTATTFIIPKAGDNALDCFRQYVALPFVSSIGPVLFSGNITNGSTYSARVDFPAIMRATPTLTFNDGGGSSGFPAAASTSGINTVGGRVFKTANATGTGFFSGGYIADARL
jgi:hypothetical protein